MEAPSVGSVILAGILLKLGGYGILRILLSIFSNGCFFFLPLIYVFSIISILYASLTAIRQLDLKRIIAYSSIAHMNIIVIGLFSNTLEGLLGGTFLMVGHGLVSSLLFFLIGFLYDRYGTRLLIYYAGLIKTMPLFTFYFLLASLGNIGLPGTSNFIGEFLIFLGIFAKNKILFFYALFSVVLTSIYSLYLYLRLIGGNLTFNIQNYYDLTFFEIIISMVLLFLILIFGISPNFILDVLNISHVLLLEKLKI